MSKLKSGLSKTEFKNGFELDFLPSLNEVASKEDLKTLLMSLEQALQEHDLPPVYVLLLMNNLMERTDIYDLLTDETRAVGGRVWSQLRASGFQLDVPPVFSDVQDGAARS